MQQRQFVGNRSTEGRHDDPIAHGQRSVLAGRRRRFRWTRTRTPPPAPPSQPVILIVCGPSNHGVQTEGPPLLIDFIHPSARKKMHFTFELDPISGRIVVIIIVFSLSVSFPCRRANQSTNAPGRVVASSTHLVLRSPLTYETHI